MADKTYSVGVVGERDVVLAFKAIGMRAVATQTPEQTTKAIHDLQKDGVPVIFITEGAARAVPETLARYQSDPSVSIIPIPGVQGSDGFGMRRVRENVEKAVGADILFSDEKEK